MWRTTTGRRTKPPPPNATGVSTGKDVQASSLTTGARKGRRERPRSFVDAQWWLFLCRMFIYAIILCSPNEREHMALNKTDAAFFFYGHNHDAIYRRQALTPLYPISCQCGECTPNIDACVAQNLLCVDTIVINDSSCHHNLVISTDASPCYHEMSLFRLTRSLTRLARTLFNTNGMHAL